MSDQAAEQFVVVENGQRASGTMSEQQAQQEANRRRQLAENQGAEAPAPKVEVKQNLFG